jgi:hypothetical protein
MKLPEPPREPAVPYRIRLQPAFLDRPSGHDRGETVLLIVGLCELWDVAPDVG